MLPQPLQKKVTCLGFHMHSHGVEGGACWSEPNAQGESYIVFSLFSLQFPFPLLLFSKPFPPRGAGD